MEELVIKSDQENDMQIVGVDTRSSGFLLAKKAASKNSDTLKVDYIIILLITFKYFLYRARQKI